METNDSNIKPQQTGGLKLMTVFIAVLALHVVVIGGFTVYHLMSGGSTDADLLTDKTHKNVKVASDGAMPSEVPLPDAGQPEKNAANPPTPAPEQTASTESNSAPSPATAVAESSAQPSGPVGPVKTGPVVNPPATPVPATTAPAVAETEPAATPAFGPAASVSGTPYVVKAHDSLARIAHQNHTSVAKLKTANGLTTDMLHIGQKLVIPARTPVMATTMPATGTESSGSTTILGGSASTPSMNIPPPKATTASAVAVHDQMAAAPAKAGHHLYTVMKGDTLMKIARKFKTTPTAIMTANNISDPAKLSIGKKLKIPGQEARSATTNEPAATQPSQIESKPAATAQLANFLQ